MCSVGIQEEIGHFSVSSASLVWLNLYASVYKHAHISMHAQLSHCLGGKGKARAWLYHRQTTKKKKIGEAIPNLRSHQPTNTRRWADVSQFEHKKNIPPLFSTYFVNLCQRLGTYHSFKNGCGGLGSEHTSVVCTAIFFFFQSPEAWRRQGALKMFCKCPNSRCGRSKSKQRELKHMYVCWNRSEAAQMGRQKLAACVEDDIRPPTIQLSRSDHMRRIQSPFHLLRFTLPNYPWLLILHPSL